MLFFTLHKFKVVILFFVEPISTQAENDDDDFTEVYNFETTGPVRGLVVLDRDVHKRCRGVH